MSFFLTAFLFLLILTTGCSNVIRAGLMNSNTVFLDPNMNRTVYLQLRNTSENQEVVLNGVQSKLAAKGYQIVTDPAHANYWIQAKVVYCHKAADGVTPESVAKAGFGSGVSSGGTTMAAVNAPTAVTMPGMMGMNGAGGMDMNAMMRMAMSRGIQGGFPGMQPPPPQEEGVTYLCVTDVQITDRKIGKPLGQLTAGQKAGASPKVQQMRAVGHVRQKDLDIPEATPIIAEKISTGITGLF
jgi:hypothetical protein